MFTSSGMTTGSALLVHRTPARRDTFTKSSSIVDVVRVKFSIDILSLDEVCVVRFSPTSIFIVTPSLGGLPAKAKDSLPTMRQTIPRRTPTQYFVVSGSYYYYYYHYYYYQYYYYYYYHYYHYYYYYCCCCCCYYMLTRLTI